MPFVTGPDVGPEGTVGACKFSILSGNPISSEIERKGFETDDEREGDSFQPRVQATSDALAG